MKIGLVPMSAKPYHAGHHMLIEFAAIASVTDEIQDLELPVNDAVAVFVSFTGRGVRKIKDPTDTRTIKQGARKIEVPKPGKTPVFGSDMKYIWANILKPNLKLPKKVKIISPEDGAKASPMVNVFDICSVLKDAYDNGEETWEVPFLNITANVSDTVINIYADSDDIVKNYSNETMTKYYGSLWKNSQGTSIQGISVPRTSTIEISGTKMRNYLCAGDFESFSKMLPPLPDAAKKEISSILSTSISCGMPLSRRSAKNESLIRQFIRLVI